MTFYARDEYEGDGTTTVFAVSFPLLSPLDIRVRLDGLLLETGWTYADHEVTFDLPPEAGVTIEIYRDTDISIPSVVFRNASTLTAENLNKANLQSLYALQEIEDTYAILSERLEDFLP